MPELDTQQMINGFVTSAAGLAGVGVNLAPPPSPQAHVPAIYFNLQVAEEIPEDTFADTVELTLKPGAKYHLRVSTSDTGQDGQSPFRISGTIDLGLFCQGVTAGGVQIANSRRKVARAELERLECDFEVTIANECPRGEATFELLFVNDKKQKYRAAQLTRFVDGKVNQVDQSLLKDVKVALDAVPPEYLAILHIEAPRPGEYRFKGWNRCIDRLTIEQQKMDNAIGLAQFVENKVDPALVLGSIQSVSRRAPQALLQWLQRLHQKHGTRLCLLIADHTDTEIPWEMLEFDQGKHLGATCIVARWIPIQNFASWLDLLVEDKRQCGSVVAHLDDQELPQAMLERQVLKLFQTDFRDDRDVLKERLTHPLQDVALVYLACHGIFYYNERHKAAVGSLENPSKRLAAVQLEGIQPQSGTRPLFFVNACHSARLMRDGQGLYGLPEVVLALLASGYIGTLGPVGTEYAPQVGQRIFERARPEPAVIHPAEELRLLRAQALEQLKQQESIANQLAVIFAFMYVFYGNPLVQLQLSAVE